LAIRVRVWSNCTRQVRGAQSWDASLSKITSPCRYTGPYYLVMTAPVLVLGFGITSSDMYEWIALGVVIVGGSGLIWWATERA
jgi:hypothetical protein